MSEKYDVVIIGAGIGGLVCGCYLAKAGLKTLIVEQHDKPGGYCTSFTRKGYRFDVGVHYLGSLNSGILRRVMDELQGEMPVAQIDPSDRIILPGAETVIRAKVQDTKIELTKSFPQERENIDRFFSFILADDFLQVYLKTKRMTFLHVLREFFKDKNLIAVFSLLLGNIGLSAGKAAAVPAIVLFREYILDCGYYPAGGMQTFANCLSRRFVSFGGELRLLTKATGIITKNPKKVLLASGEEVSTKVVISNADATLTFNNLVDSSCKESDKLKEMEYSPSMFLVYLGLKYNVGSVLKDKANLWYFSTSDIDTLYSRMATDIPEKLPDCVMCSFPSLHDSDIKRSDSSTAIIFIHAPYKNQEFWRDNKVFLGDRLIEKASEVIPGLRENIVVKEYATPVSFERYTSNKDGAFVGWLSTVKQINASLLPQRSSIHGLYLVGHWTSMGYPGYGGIPNVAFSGRRGAMVVLQDLGVNWPYKEIKL